MVAAPIGNKFWMMRSTHGREPIFASPELLWSAACEYFEWVHNNPLQEEKLFHAQGIITKDSVCKMRAMTIQALCFFLDISDDSWADIAVVFTWIAPPFAPVTSCKFVSLQPACVFK
jgi:hypothetical protein